MRELRRIGIVLFMSAIGLQCWSRYGEIIGTKAVDGMCYNIVSDGTATLFGNLEEFGGDPDFSGPFVVPNYVEYEGQLYTVDCINPAFQNIPGLTAIIIPENVYYISTSFSFCPNLKQIIFEDSEVPCEITIGNSYGSRNSGVEYIYIGRPTTNRAELSYLGGTTLKTVHIGGSSVKKSIAMNDFSNCLELKSVIIEGGVDMDGYGHNFNINNCPKLTTIYFSEMSQLQYLPDYFRGCNSLEVVDLPSTLSGIADNALTDAPLTCAMVCHAIVPPVLRDYTFSPKGNSYNPIYVPSLSVDDYKSAPYWSVYYGSNIKPIEEPTELTLNVTELSMKSGDVARLTTNNVKTIYVKRWSTSNPEVATVIDGSVYAIGEGECDITVNCGNESQAVCHVKVYPILKSINLSPTEVVLNQDESIEVDVSTVPSSFDRSMIKWESSNEDVAKVISGVVTGINPGEAIITASYDDDKIASSIKIKVNKSKYTLSLCVPDGGIYIIDDLTEPFTFRIIPNDGWRLSSASLNDKDVTEQIDENGQFTTPDDKDDKVLRAVFEKDVVVYIESMNVCEMKILVKETGVEVVGKLYDEVIQIYDVNGICFYSGKSNWIPFPYKGNFILTTPRKNFKFVK